MRRWLWNALCASSAAICLLCIILWIRSHSNATSIIRNHRDFDGDVLHTETILSERGRLYLITEMFSRGGPPKSEYQTDDASLDVPHRESWDLAFELVEAEARANPSTALPVTHRRALGLEAWCIGNEAYPNASAALIVPWWILAAVAGALPAAWIRRRRRVARRTTQGLCSSCGYDLRATPGAPNAARTLNV